MSDVKTKKDWYDSATWIDDDAADVDAYVSGLKKSELPGYDLKQKLTQWRDDGVVIFEGVIDRKLIDIVNHDVSFVMDNHRKYHVGIDGDAELYEKYKYLDQLSSEQVKKFHIKLSDFHTFSRAAAQISMVPEAISFLGHVFRSQPALLQSLTFSIGSEQPLHQDYPYVFNQGELAKLAAFWIPLEDIQADAGPLAYYCGSQKVSRLGFFDWGNGAINQFDRFGNEAKFEEYDTFLKARIEALKLKPLLFLPKKGDLLIWHGALIHTGTTIVNRSLTRRSFVGHYTSLGGHQALKQHRMGGGFVFDAADGDIAANQSDSPGVLRRVKNLAKRALK